VHLVPSDTVAAPETSELSLYSSHKKAARRTRSIVRDPEMLKIIPEEDDDEILVDT